MAYNSKIHDFEHVLVRSFNKYFLINGISALAYRLLQSKYQSQRIDIIIDSNEIQNFAIECKSTAGLNKTHKLNFKSNFTTDKNGLHQIDRITQYRELTGRDTYLAIELRKGQGRAREAHFIPWDNVLELYNTDTGIELKTVLSYPGLVISNGVYQITSSFFDKLSELEVNKNGIYKRKNSKILSNI